MCVSFDPLVLASSKPISHKSLKWYVFQGLTMTFRRLQLGQLLVLNPTFAQIYELLTSSHAKQLATV